MPVHELAFKPAIGLYSQHDPRVALFMDGEPIVNTSTEAIKDFYGMDLDVLVLEDIVVEKPERYQTHPGRGVTPPLGMLRTTVSGPSLRR